MNHDEAIRQCICKTCPSYFECGEKIAFCLYESGKSKCIVSEVGCVCPGCPVQLEMSFKKVYYCTRGSAEEQNNKS